MPKSVLAQSADDRIEHHRLESMLLKANRELWCWRLQCRVQFQFSRRRAKTLRAHRGSAIDPTPPAFLAGVSASLIDTMTGSSSALAGLSPLSTLLLWLRSINILLAVFNLIPGFPLDGGRILRSILWAITGNLRRATRWASGVGQIFAWLFIVAGLAMVFGAQIPFLESGFINGLWPAFIGWFLNSAAVQSYRQQVVIQDVLRGVPVARIMLSNPPTVPSNISISSLVHDHVMGTDDYSLYTRVN